MNKCVCGNSKKLGKAVCYTCHLTAKSGKTFAAATKVRLQLRNIKRHQRNSWKKFRCEMGYGDCEARGFCNGDC